MKKWWWILLLCIALCGCDRAVYETMSDTYEVPERSPAGEVALILPQEAVRISEETEVGEFYLCKDFTLCVETFSSGDLNKTLLAVSGYGREELSLLQTGQDGVKRYEWVWASAGEAGDQVSRGVLLDDGAHHYVLTLQTDAELAGELSDQWQEIARSFSLGIGP